MRSPVMNFLARAAATWAVTGSWLVLFSLQAHAATNGKIVFERGSQLYLTDPSTYSAADGTVTETLFGGGSQPHVSLDGSKLVFLNSAQIAISPAGTYTPQGLVTAGGGASLVGLYPRLSLDGSLVAYQNPGTRGKIVITTVGCTSGNENNSSVCNSTTLDAASAFSSIHPSWYPLLSASGSNRNAWILFVRMADESATVGDIFMTSLVVAPNGVVTAGSASNLTRSPAAYSFPAYSPDGQHIVFGRDGGLWAMNSDGTNAKQIVHDAGGTLGLLSGKHPVWSPDSRKIAFDYGDDAGQIYVADIAFAGGTATASNVTEMSSLNGASNGDTYPSWLPGAAAPSLILSFDGRLRDRVGKGDASIGPDGEVDGAFTVTMPSAGLTISRLELCQQSFPCSTSTNTGGRWDTVPGNGSWVIGAADTLDQQPSPVFNGADGSINRQFGSTFKIFISDLSPSAFVSGAWFTLTAYANGSPISGRVLLTETPSSLADVGIQFWPRPPSKVPIGDVFTYDFLVRNNGPDAATNVNVITFVPAALEFVPSGSPASCVLSAGGNVTCSLGDLPPGLVGATFGSSVKKVSIAMRGLQHGKVNYSIKARAASPGDPNTGNDEEYATTTIVPEVVLIGLEVTQGIQDLANNVPLVAGKHTFVRAHLKSASPASDGGLISGILTAKNVTTGAFLGTIANCNIGVTIPTKQNPDRGQLDDSLYFEVPFGQFLGDGDWTQGRIEYYVEVNNAKVSCAEPDNNPNDCMASVTFQAQQPLSIKFVGITWTDTGGTTHTPTLADVSQAMSEVLGVFPISAFDIDLGVMTTALDPCFSVTDASGVTSDPNMGNIKAEIAKLRQTDCAAGPCKSVYLGLMADQATCSIGPSNGQGTFPVPDPDPNLSWGRAIAAFAKTDDAMPRVHEISHCTGNHHTNSGAREPGFDPAYVPANGNISPSTSPFARATAYGFDVNQISTQRVYGPATMDFMSYARPRWIGIYNYNKLFRFFSPANGNAQSRPGRETPMVPADRLLLVSGQVSTTDGTGRLDPLNVTNTPGTVTFPEAGSYAIRLEDVTGKELATYSFEPNRATDGDMALVSLTLPWNTGTRRVVLLHAGVPIASRQASASEPIVTVTSPNGGESLTGTTATFSWTASDPESDPLVYTVEYSVDGGTTWKTLAVDLASTSFRADLTSLPGSVRALIRVSAHDGFHTTRDQSDAVFAVPEHAPQAAILTPEDGHLYVGDQTILLQGMALDLETGLLPNSSLTWSSNLGGSLGTGSPLRLDVASLLEGTHVITLAARDGSGQTGTARITIQIARERPALLAGPLVVPIVLDVESGAAHYTTELALTNPGTSSTNVSLTYTASLGTKEGSGTVSESVPAGQQIVFADVISYLRSRGLAIPVTAGAPQGGTLLVTPSGSSPEFVATARTTTATQPPLTEGAAGLAYGGIPVSAGITGKAVIFGLRSTTDDRSNVAVFNMSADPVTVKVTAISGEGDSRSVVIAEAESLPAYGWLQHTRILDGTGISNGYVTVERVSSTGTFGVYGVVNDNVTSDGSYMAPVTDTFSENTMTLPVIVETSVFRSELVLANRGSATATLKLTYVESLTSSGGAGGTTTVTVAAGEQKIIPEAVDYLRTHGVAIGAMDSGNYAGTVRVTVSGVSLSDAYVGARTGARVSGGGQFGLFTPPVYSGQEASSSAVIYALRADQNNRSNVAVVHAGADGSATISLQLQAFDGSEGGVAKGEPFTVTLAPGQWSQPPGFFAASGIQNGYVKISRTSGSAPWLAYGVVNDGNQPGDRTGDGAYITAVPAAGGSSTLR